MRTHVMNEQLEQIELSIDQAKESVAKMKALNKLTDNKEFTQLIREGYFEKEASRLVLMLAEPAMQEETSQEMLQKQITAIGYLRQYFITINQMGRMAQKSLTDDEETREALLAEDV